MTLTHYGIREWGTALVVLVLILAGCWYLAFEKGYMTAAVVIASVAALLFLVIAAFFRSPCRRVPANPCLITSPADGTVCDIVEVDDFKLPPFEGPAVRVGIFLSVLDVHVNRAPAAFTVENVSYREGEYLDARSEGASQRNEAMTISGTAVFEDDRLPIAVRQISGAIARRIVCPVKPGRKLRKGEIYGMIKFGSRTELYLPVGRVELSVKVGDKVKGGASVIATLTE
ncbi:MAG: phosphatidylserine decarboxylase family protein [Lentisphaeria bacterium]|nr:phosphatidylserine decarboxylase family protein [Lentisphaeria bacterium]